MKKLLFFLIIPVFTNAQIDSINQFKVSRDFAGSKWSTGVIYRTILGTQINPVLFFAKGADTTFVNGYNSIGNVSITIPQANSILVASVNGTKPQSGLGNVILPINRINVVNKGFLLNNGIYIGFPSDLDNLIMTQVTVANFPVSGHIESILPTSIKYTGETNINTPVFTFIGVANPANPNGTDKNVIKVQSGDMINGVVNGTLSYGIGESYSVTSDGNGYVVIQHTTK